MKIITTLEISSSADQPYSLHYNYENGNTVGAPSYLEAYTEDEAKEELAEEYGYSPEQIESLFGGEIDSFNN